MSNHEKTILNEEKIFESMIKAGVHYGRAKRYTHQSMKPFLLKSNKNIELFNLKITLQKLNELRNFLKKILEENKSILFLGTTPASALKVKELAETLNQYYLNYKWVGGFLTNFQTFQARLVYFKDLLAKEESGELNQYFPKERSKLEKELKKLKLLYSGVIKMEKLPDYIFIINLAFPGHQTAKREALRMKIPIISISGSDNNINGVSFFVPANDKAPSSIAYLVDYLKEVQKSN